jgi:hypothetical protein
MSRLMTAINRYGPAVLAVAALVAAVLAPDTYHDM